jgi:hypothetical protein
VTPRHGARHTVFTVAFTARDATAQPSGTTSRYLITATRNRATRSLSCTSSVSRDAGTAAVGQRVHVRLAGARRWCLGGYRATVVLQRQFVCTQPPGGPPVACPAIAFAPLDTGHVTFVVR